MPIFIISGEEDPVEEYGRLVNRLYGIYKNVGSTLVDIKIYPSKRHEILNEINREEVFEDILNWIKEKVYERR
ncbi:Serine aminopeptidase, S33 [Thermoanaerobacter thermohydrosulfuricus]|uniref:Serine aminopeptidase, S33 n=1 Tax=Thermoanaerobacter thermohydrosulfuricus TaxID=1516 RepID=A0A1G7WXX5_THETY|nr:lysophospholipase [Thermoanaerobacter ethanolicus JW 200]SDG76779.1 Serine aminopeptidase, S33 [Thermoanaerobacter thermohydrosulfuricus]SFE10702.1 Serine aminopeptidase, S33 [Thermoanaerobacter thermohydrosulfuricus]HHY80996.1 lysophospholipase [Thermoanaerobacter sp.]